jgi:hypothetical protein
MAAAYAREHGIGVREREAGDIETLSQVEALRLLVRPWTIGLRSPAAFDVSWKGLKDRDHAEQATFRVVSDGRGVW